jgi:hypothetical protein
MFENYLTFDARLSKKHIFKSSSASSFYGLGEPLKVVPFKTLYIRFQESDRFLETIYHRDGNPVPTLSLPQHVNGINVQYAGSIFHRSHDSKLI